MEFADGKGESRTSIAVYDFMYCKYVILMVTVKILDLFKAEPLIDDVNESDIKTKNLTSRFATQPFAARRYKNML